MPVYIRVSHSFNAQARSIVEGVIDESVANAADVPQSNAPAAVVSMACLPFVCVPVCVCVCMCTYILCIYIYLSVAWLLGYLVLGCLLCVFGAIVSGWIKRKTPIACLYAW